MFHLLDRKQAPHTRDELRKLSRKGRMCLRSICKIELLFCNEVIKRCLQPIAQLDFLSSFTLLNPNLVKFPRFHDRLLDVSYQLLDRRLVTEFLLFIEPDVLHSPAVKNAVLH